MRRPDLLRRERPILSAITGMTAWGIGLFSYIINRSADHIIPYVSLPVVALGALWLALVGRPALGVPAAGRRVALGGALGVSALLVATAWSLGRGPLPAVRARARVPGEHIAVDRPGAAVGPGAHPARGGARARSCSPSTCRARSAASCSPAPTSRSRS